MLKWRKSGQLVSRNQSVRRLEQTRDNGKVFWVLDRKPELFIYLIHLYFTPIRVIKSPPTKI